MIVVNNRPKFINIGKFDNQIGIDFVVYYACFIKIVQYKFRIFGNYELVHNNYL